MPHEDRERIRSALEGMRDNPFQGDLVRLTNDPRAAWRRRVGNHRILFDVYPERSLIDVVAIERRTSATY